MTMWDLNDSKAKFVHAGHMQKINQIDLHPTEPRTIASVDDDNEIQVFQPTKMHLYDDLQYYLFLYTVHI